MPFACTICEEESTRICVWCTKDTCANHLCEKCGRCSDCCECDVPLTEPVHDSHMYAAPAELAPQELPELGGADMPPANSLLAEPELEALAAPAPDRPSAPGSDVLAALGGAGIQPANFLPAEPELETLAAPALDRPPAPGSDVLAAPESGLFAPQPDAPSTTVSGVIPVPQPDALPAPLPDALAAPEPSAIAAPEPSAPAAPEPHPLPPPSPENTGQEPEY